MRSASERVQDANPELALPAIESVLAVLVHASVLDGVVAAVKVLTVTLVLDLPITPAIAVGGLVAFAIYASNKLVDAEDEINAPDRARFVAAHRDALIAATAAATALAVGLAAHGGALEIALTLLPAVAAVAYSVPLPGVDRRLKDVLGVNNLLVSVSWALPVVALPVAWADAEFTATAGVVFAFYLGQTVVAFEVRNVRDVAGDRAEGVNTLPVVLGVPTTRVVLYAIDALALTAYTAAGWTGVLAMPVAAAFALATLVSLCVTATVARSDDGPPSTPQSRATVPASTRMWAVVTDLSDARLAAGRDATYVLVLAIVALAG
jgi:4-hydroxybenzoate polyprenyltransferase